MAGEHASTSQFEQLVAELDTLAKALPADTDDDADAIAAAAAEGGGEAGGDGDADDKGGKPDGDADDKGPMAKSFTVKLEDGTEVEAVDGAELVKALQAQVSGLEGGVAKALGSAVGLLKQQGELLTKQGEMIKSLSASVAALRREPGGRKSTVSVHEPVVAKALGGEEKKTEGVSAQEFMVKAMDAFNAGKLTGGQVALAEASINRGEQPPADIVKAVLS